MSIPHSATERDRKRSNPKSSAGWKAALSLVVGLLLLLSSVACQIAPTPPTSGSSATTPTVPTAVAVSSATPVAANEARALPTATPTAPSPTSSPAPPASPTSAPTVTTAVPSATTASPAQTQATASFSGEIAKQHVDVLAGQIGSRPAGTDQQDAAVQYLAEQLRSWGYEPEVQRFPIRLYEDRGAKLEVVQPEARSIEARTMLYSPPGEFEAEAVYVGLGSAEDFRGVSVEGKIALIRRGVLRFGDKVANAAAAGAAGAVIFNDRAAPIQGSLGETGQIPAVGIGGEEGEALVRDLENGPLTLRIAVDGSVRESEGANVIATKAGTRPGTVVIGGHMDSVPTGPGANDNASGTAAVLELARVFAARDYPYTLRFVAFGAEEIGLLGSRHYVEQLSDTERGDIVAMLNLDMVGVGDVWQFGGDDALVQKALDFAAQRNVRATPLGESLSRASDHANFDTVGVPTLFFYRSDDPNYHSANDLPEYVDEAALAQVGEFATLVLEDLAAEQR